MKFLIAILAAIALIPSHPVKESLDELCDHFQIHLIYDAGIEKILRSDCSHSFNPQLTLSQNLDNILSDTGLVWISEGKYIILKTGTRHLSSQRRKSLITVSGFVKDRSSGETLIGAGVYNGSDGTVTNEYGYYSLKVPSGTNLLHFSHVGYEERIIELNSDRDTVVNISFNPNLTIGESSIISFRENSLHSARPGMNVLTMDMIKSSTVVLGEPDLIKTLQLMPGIQSGVEGFSGIYVRGGGPDENLIMLDGVAIYNVSHMFGLFSAFTPEAVKKVTVYTGAFPARYGGRVSSVIDVRTNDGNQNEFKGSVSVGLLTDKIHLEGPLGDGRTTFSASARAMHTFLVSPVLALLDNKLNYLFYDLNGKLCHRFSDNDKLSFSIYNGKDKFIYTDIEKNKAEYDINAAYGNTVLSLNHTHVFGNRLFSDFMVAWNNYGMNLSQSVDNRYFSYSSGIRDLIVKDSFDWALSGSNRLNFGAEYVFHHFMPESSVISIPDSPENRYSGQVVGCHEASLFISDYLSSDIFTVEAGARLTWFLVQGKGRLNLQPRLSLCYLPKDDLSFKAAYSRMNQYVHQLASGDLSLPSDLWVPVTKNLEPEVSDIYSVGAYYTGLGKWEFSVETYWKSLHNVIDYVDGRLTMQANNGWESNVAMGDGRSYGVEFSVRRTAGKTTGSLSYTLSRSERIFPDGSINNGEWFPFQYDRRHSVTASLTHRFNENIDFGALWVFNSGNCITVPENMTEVIYPDPSSPDGFSHLPFFHITSRNNYRLPSSHRLDLSVNFRKQKKNGERVWTVGIYNLYNAKNPNFVIVDRDITESGQSFDYSTNLYLCTFLTALPFFSYTFNF